MGRTQDSAESQSILTLETDMYPRKHHPRNHHGVISQGSVLGLTLFDISIDDLLANIKSEGLLFADDRKKIHQINIREDALILQSGLSLLEQWSKNWILNFHPDKYHVPQYEIRQHEALVSRSHH